MKNKVIKILLSITLIIGLMSGFSVPVHASGKVVISVSASNVNIGETVTIKATPLDDSGKTATATLTFKYDTSLFSFVSCNAGDGNYGGGPGGEVTASAAFESVSITLKAIAPGSKPVTVSGADGVNSNQDELGALAQGGVNITVANAVSGGGDSANLSGDTSLSSLKISPGSLSPAFKSGTTKYTANVAEDITSIAVDAKPANGKAAVTSVTGNTNLAMGSNTVKIVVKAENGTTAAYTITVNRGTASEETTTGNPDETTVPEDGSDGSGETTKVNVKGISMSIAANLDSASIPEGFTEDTYTYEGKTYPVAVNQEKGLILFYLTDDAANTSGFYIYDAKNNTFYKYQTITIGSGVYILLQDEELKVPEGYKRTTLTLGDQEVEGWIGDFDQEYGLIYAMNPAGEKNLYLYDLKENTMIRVNDKLFASLSQETKETGGAADFFGKLSQKTWIYLVVIAVLAIACIILLISYILLSRKNRRFLPEDELFQEELDESEVEYIDTDDEDDSELEDEELEYDELDINESNDNLEDSSEPAVGMGVKEEHLPGKDSLPESQEERNPEPEIAKDALTQIKLEEFTKKCEDIIGGQRKESSQDVSGTKENSSMLDDEDFEIVDLDDEGQ